MAERTQRDHKLHKDFRPEYFRILFAMLKKKEGKIGDHDIFVGMKPIKLFDQYLFLILELGQLRCFYIY